MNFAVDFDGTLVSNKYPEIGYPNYKLIEFCKRRQKMGNNIILWTCRTGKHLDEAITFLKDTCAFIPDYINENAPWDHSLYEDEGRKIGADYYIDDKAINIDDIDKLIGEFDDMKNLNDGKYLNYDDPFVNKVNNTIASNKINMQDVDLTKINSNLATSTIQFAGIDAWGPYIGKCPKCGSTNIEANYGLVLTSYPPQYNCRCKDCKHGFFSGQINQENESDIAKPNFPKDPGWVPYNPDPKPANPGYGYGNRQGWICPRCGKVNSPDRDFCDCSNNTPYSPNIVWCNANGSGDYVNPNMSTAISRSNTDKGEFSIT